MNSPSFADFLERIPLQRKLIAGLIGIFLALAIFGFSMFRALGGLQSANDWVVQTQNVIADARNLTKLMLDMETGLRGYLIVGNEDFLEPFENGEVEFMGQLAHMEAATRDDTAQVTRLGTIDRLHNRWLSQVANPEIDLRRRINAAAEDPNADVSMQDIVAFVETERGKTIIDEFRATIDEFIRVEQAVMADRMDDVRRRQDTASATAVGGVIAAIVLGLSVLWMVIRTTGPLRKLTAAMTEIAESEDYTRKLDVGGMYEVGRVAKVFNRMAENTSNEVWLKKSATAISQVLQESSDLTELCDKTVAVLGDLLGCGFAAFYLYNEESGRYDLAGRYRFMERDHSRTSYGLKEGLVGQCAAEKRTMVLNDVPEDYVKVQSGLGEAAPDTVMTVPLIHRDQVLGVLELATFGTFGVAERALLREQIPNVALGLESMLRRVQTELLLRKTQTQTEALTVTEEELRQSNDHLATQSNELKRSQVELEERNDQLQVQQEELRVVNEELEERAGELAASRAQLEEKNLSLEGVKLQLERRAQDLAVSSKYKSQFLANMSHELRTPLNSLLILSKLLADNKEGTLTEKQTSYARTISDSGEDLLELINDILDLSKIESGKVDIHSEPIRLGDFVAELNRRFESTAKDKDIQFDIDTAGAPPVIRSDAQKLGQIIKNLLSNAIKFTENGTVELRIDTPSAETFDTTSQLSPDNAIAFSVRDTGIGIPSNKLSSVFEAFQQVDGSTSRKYGGTGLGLSISRELAKVLGGYIHVTSEVGKGSTFTLVIPQELEVSAIEDQTHIESSVGPHAESQPAIDISVVQHPGTNHAPASTIEDALSAESIGIPDDRHTLEAGDRSILIIEDDDRFASIVADAARERGFAVLVAESGETGLHFADYYRPSAIILDMGLPGIDGWDVITHLKDNANTRHIPVHIVSATDVDPDAMRSGAIGFLTKPVSLEAMKDVFTRFEDIIDRPVKRLLLVEDEAIQRAAILADIGDSDIEITTVDNGTAALEILEKEQFDCIVIDLGLPDMNGIDIVEKLGSGDKLEHTPVVIHSGRELEPKEQAILERYAHSIITKNARSPERLLDDTALFLHRVEADLPESKRNTLRMLHNAESVFQGRTVLLVDDDMRNLFSLSAILQEKGMEIVTASNGQEAVDKFVDEFNVDLVLMDIMMPEMDGYEAMRHIRELPDRSTVPIIALTAKAMRGDRAACIEAGANDYLAKPVKADKLLSMMRVWLYR